MPRRNRKQLDHGLSHKPKGGKRPRGWHRGPGVDEQFREAIERIERHLDEELERTEEKAA